MVERSTSSRRRGRRERPRTPKRWSAGKLLGLAAVLGIVAVGAILVLGSSGTESEESTARNESDPVATPREERRTYTGHGLVFEHPASMATSAEATLGGMMIGVKPTEGEFSIFLSVYGPHVRSLGVAHGTIVRSYRTKLSGLGSSFGPECESRGRRVLAGESRDGTTFTCRVGEETWIIEIYTFWAAGKIVSAVFQRTGDHERAEEAFEVISETLRVE